VTCSYHQYNPFLLLRQTSFADLVVGPALCSDSHRLIASMGYRIALSRRTWGCAQKSSVPTTCACPGPCFRCLFRSQSQAWHVAFSLDHGIDRFVRVTHRSSPRQSLTHGPGSPQCELEPHRPSVGLQLILHQVSRFEDEDAASLWTGGLGVEHCPVVAVPGDRRRPGLVPFDHVRTLHRVSFCCRCPGACAVPAGCLCALVQVVRVTLATTRRQSPQPPAAPRACRERRAILLPGTSLATRR